LATQINRVVFKLRELILSGELAPGERIIELQYSAILGVSRTPMRIALGELEKEGLIERLPSRGFRVKAFSSGSIADAVDVRGVLEGFAVRLLAENGIEKKALTRLMAAVEKGRYLVDQATQNPGGTVDAHAWAQTNKSFHETLIEAAGNHALAQALALNNSTPLTAPGALALSSTPTSLETSFVLRAQTDHEDILSAITGGQASRAEALMREHLYKSRENKKFLLEKMRANLSLTGSSNPAEDVFGFAQVASAHQPVDTES